MPKQYDGKFHTLSACFPFTHLHLRLPHPKSYSKSTKTLSTMYDDYSTIAPSVLLVNQFLPRLGHFLDKDHSSKKSILLTETSYATRFSVSVSESFLTYSLLWILPQTCTWPPTSKPDANRAFLPQQIHGI